MKRDLFYFVSKRNVPYLVSVWRIEIASTELSTNKATGEEQTDLTLALSLGRNKIFAPAKTEATPIRNSLARPANLHTHDAHTHR